MDEKNENRLMVILGTVGLITLGYIAQLLIRADEREFYEKAKLPAEYWIAQKADVEASVERRKLELESQERMTLDSRERADAKRRELMEFEQNAPDAYWQSKIEAEKEETIRLLNKQHAENERIKAKQQAEQMRSIERTIRGLQ